MGSGGDSVSQDPSAVQIQKTIYQSRNPTRKWLHSSRREWIINSLKRMAAEKIENALEVGPGSGVYIPALSECCTNVTVIDVEDSFLADLGALAHRYPSLKLLGDDIARSLLPSNSFDLILCSEVVEHIRDSQTAIKEMHRLLKPGGILILSTPQKYSPLEILAKIAFLPGIKRIVSLLYREPVQGLGHLNLLTRNDLVHQLTSAGFRLNEYFTSGFYLPVFAELAGETAVLIEQWLEKKCRRGSCQQLLWTQYVIAQAC